MRQLRANHITLASVGEFSRDKTKLISNLFLVGYGQRMLPPHVGRATVYLTELFHNLRAECSYIRLLPIETCLINTSAAQFKHMSRH